MIPRFLLIMLCLAALSGTVWAETAELPAQPLSADDAVAYGLTHNRVLRASEYDVEAANQKVRQAQADYLPKVEGDYAFTHLSEQPFFAINGERIPSAHQTTNKWEVGLTQPLFKGGGLSAQVESSKTGLKIAERGKDATRLDVVRNIRQAFWHTLLAEKLLMVARDNVNSLEVHRRNAEANFKQGLAAQNDVLKAEVALAQAKQSERQFAKQLEILRSSLNRLLDLDLQTKLTLKDDELKPGDLPALDSLCAKAEETRPEYLSLKDSIRQTEDAEKAARSRYYPQVSAFARYEREGEDFIAERNDYSNNDNAAVGVRVDWNLFEGGKTDATVKEQRARRAGLQERLRDLKHGVCIEVEDSFEQARVARANIDTARSALAQAEENERMTSLQYREQMVIFLEVLNAQVFLAQTKVDYYRAVYGYRTALADLERAVGSGG
ncbi:MAG: TolC family protein [Acidobacteriota bacterium]